MTTPTPRDIELARECREKVRCAMTGKAEITHIADYIALARAEEREASERAVEAVCAEFRRRKDLMVKECLHPQPLLDMESGAGAALAAIRARTAMSVAEGVADAKPK